MRVKRKWIFWLIGFAILLFLIQYPLKKLNSTWTHLGLPLNGKVIVLDPGHGGVDGGAVANDETSEKEIALFISKRLQAYLEQAGATVYLTRSTDTDLASDGTKGIAKRKSEDIRNRLTFIEEKDPDIFLSMHLNSLPDARWSGAQTFYYPSQNFPENEVLAKSIQQEIVVNLENTDRSALTIQGIYLLKHTQVPGALVEVGFLSHPGERELLKTAAYQEKMANSIYFGILDYFDEAEE